MPRRYVRILTGGAIVILALGLVYTAWVGISAVKLRRAYAALKSDGRPMCIADIIPPQVSEPENAALLYQSAAMLLKAMPVPERGVADIAALPGEKSIRREKLRDILGYLGDLSNRLVRESLDADERRELEQLLRQEVVRTALWAVEQGTERPGCRFDRDYEAGMGVPMLNLLDLQNLCRILGAQACIAAEAGRNDEAWRLTQVQLKFASALRAEPTLIDQMVGMDMVGFSCRTIRKLCEITIPPDGHRDELSGLLSEHEDIGSLIRALDGERLLFGEWVFSRPINEVHRMGPIIPGQAYVPALVQRVMLYRISFRPFFLADHASYLRLMRETVQLWQEPHSPEKTEALERQIQKARKHSLVTDMLLPSVGRIRRVHTRMVAQIRITQTGLALIQYQRTHGAFPETLDTLETNTTQDPFSDEVLGYQHQGTGFVLHSIGPDRKDNDGGARRRRQKTDADILWRFSGRPTP
ncbi:hypothetical protein [Anaerobaca lacustris]|uniref:Uncharacterized protein n=1 Tax=Anaerobaca lacustris TaxID=3044600 RepID=A0AAW6U4T5_9BACT|nr:hypothetical protein [Sedimentisphaerales bacterium M17dextr]